MNIGELIHERRIALGLTLEEVGNIVGVSKSTVKKWETGDISNMRRDKIALLAKALQISPVMLINDNNTGSQDYVEDEDEKKILLLARHLKKIPEQKRKRILESFEDTIDTYLEGMGISKEK